jgi:[1-hydroxy-2-(trimethylamino)ethyl]phosphonate dioxygenase
MGGPSVEEIIELYETWGVQHYDEDITQLDHALQTAALAVSEHADDALVAAALLHDVGHLLELRGGGLPDGQTAADLAHEGRGARYLAGTFGPEVTGPIALHVAAKRYRCAVEPAYAASLSAGSTRSLARQGGPMAPDEVSRFEANPTHDAAVRLRGWDDGGKVDGLEVTDLASYRPLLERVARQPGAPAAS